MKTQLYVDVIYVIFTRRIRTELLAVVRVHFGSKKIKRLDGGISLNINVRIIHLVTIE